MGQCPKPANPCNMIASEKTSNKKEVLEASLERTDANETRDIMEDYFMKKALGKREHEFAKGKNTAAEAAQRPLKGKVL